MCLRVYECVCGIERGRERDSGPASSLTDDTVISCGLPLRGIPATKTEKIEIQRDRWGEGQGNRERERERKKGRERQEKEKNELEIRCFTGRLLWMR